MKRTLLPQLNELVARVEGWRGSVIEVVEQITRMPGSVDRHCTTTSTLVMRLEYVSIAFSGAALMLLGRAFEKDVGYQAALDLLAELTIGTGEVVFVERFGAVAERHSRLRLLPDVPADELGGPTRENA